MATVQEHARNAMPILVERAKHRGTITCKELGKALGASPSSTVPKVLGHIREVLLTGDVPVLTSLVADDGVTLEQQDFLPELREAVYSYKGWDAELRMQELSAN